VVGEIKEGRLLSIFVMYSTDREKQLQYTLGCLEKMDGYKECQKTLVVDGRMNQAVPDGWEFVQVPRIGGKFCWASMWDAGVASARHPIVLYLDSDRLLPSNYLKLVVETVGDGIFAFTSRHFQALRDLPLEWFVEFLESDIGAGAFTDERFLGSIRYEPRFKAPVHGPGKNVMSGNTAFLKSTYRRLGGVDHWYRGHGAYADTDFHYAATVEGCAFVDLLVPELHLQHPKLEEGKALPEMELRRQGLDNFIYYCRKWSLPLVLAENLAVECGVSSPVKYVDKKVSDFDRYLHEIQGMAHVRGVV
jgi:hypothetical protein